MADDSPGSFLPPLFDMDHGLREIARTRGKRDSVTRAQVQLSDALAEFVNRHFSPEEIETAGRALMIAASCTAGLIGSGVSRPEVIVNVIGFAGGRLVTDGRAWTEAGTEDTRG